MAYVTCVYGCISCQLRSYDLHVRHLYAHMGLVNDVHVAADSNAVCTNEIQGTDSLLLRLCML